MRTTRWTARVAAFLLAGFIVFSGYGILPANGQPTDALPSRGSSNFALKFSADRATTKRITLGDDNFGLQIGDRILVAVYGRNDISREYRLNSLGQITIPSVGTFDAKSRSSSQLEADIRQELERSTNRSAYVTIDVVQRRPIFVTGHVAKPGAYEFAPGMAVIHATTIAGGLSSAALSESLPIAALRESSRLRSAQKEMIHLIARRARLLAAKNGKDVVVSPRELVTLAGVRQAAKLVQVEQSILIRELAVIAARALALSSAVKQGEIEITAIEKERLKIEDQRRLRENVVAAIRKLGKKGLATAQRMTDASLLLASVDRDAQNIIALKARALQRWQTAKRDLALLPLQRKNEIDTELRAINQQLSSLRETVNGARRVIEKITGLPFTFLTDGQEKHFGFEILRKVKDAKLSVLDANETTPLRPGDVVRVNAFKLRAEQTNLSQ